MREFLDKVPDLSEAIRFANDSFRPTPEIIASRDELMSSMLGIDNERTLTAEARMEELDRAVLEAFMDRARELRQAQQHEGEV